MQLIRFPNFFNLVSILMVFCNKRSCGNRRNSIREPQISGEKDKFYLASAEQHFANG